MSSRVEWEVGAWWIMMVFSTGSSAMYECCMQVAMVALVANR